MLLKRQNMVIYFFVCLCAQHGLAFDAASTFQQVCAACHSAPKGPDHRDRMVAPPAFAVKAHYIEHFSDKDTFVKAVVRYLKNPIKDDSLMPNAVEKFGLMNKLPYSDEEFTALATYLYGLDLETPPGFLRHRAQECKQNQARCDSVKATADRLRKIL
jgi:hypothetical protein